MTDFNRIKALAGLNPKHDLIEALKASRAEMNAAHDKLIKQLEDGMQLDEGLFNALKAAIKTVGNVGKDGVDALGNKVKALASKYSELYQDHKAQEELKDLTKGLKAVIDSFDKLEKSVPTILSRDDEVKKLVEIFKRALIAIISALESRLQGGDGDGGNA